VPVIEDDGFAVAESAAVVLYVAEMAGKLIPHDFQGPMRVIQWCFAAFSSVEPTLVCLVMRHDDGTPRMVYLKTDAVVDGIPCLAASNNGLSFDEQGRLDSAAVSTRYELQGWTLEPGDEFSLRSDRSLSSIRLAQPREFGGHQNVESVSLDEGGRPSELEVGTATIDAEGRLLRRDLASPETLDGIPCVSFAMFHANGRLAASDLAAPLETSHGIVPAGSMVSFDADGRLSHAIVADTCVLGRWTFPAGNPVQFTEGEPVPGGAFCYTTPPGPPKPPFLT